MSLNRWMVWIGCGALASAACSNASSDVGAAGGQGTPTGGRIGTGGSAAPAGGSSSGGSASSAGGGSAVGGAPLGGGASAGGGAPALGGSGGDNPGSCNSSPWPAADPSMAGPYETVTEMNVGPLAGEGEDGEPTDFTIFRPAELGTEGRCHPIITWGNGTGSTPNLYRVLLNHLASHGFVVIGSNSPNVGQGNPQPMVVGVTWLKEQNSDPTSPYYQRLDVAHVGATGHSQGGFATTNAGNDPNITTIAPLCGGGNPRTLSGPAFIFCGGMDPTVTCESVERAFTAIDDQPAMLANYLTADHADWISFSGNRPKPVEVAVTAWMRVQLMNDTTLRDWFYGASCKLCTDPEWAIQQFMMDP